MDQDQMRTLFEQVRTGAVDIDAAIGRMRHMPFEDLGFVTVELMGNEVVDIDEMGVACILCLLSNRGRWAQARVVGVCAGMEGALPSVVGGLVWCPVMARPTSLGYGASFNGLAASLGMLN